MSLIMILPGTGGIVLAADSRSSTVTALGQVNGIADNSLKLLPVNGNMGILTHGIRDIGFRGISTLSRIFPRRNGVRINTVVTRAASVFLQTDQVASHCMRTYGDVGFFLAGFEPPANRYRSFGFSSPGYIPYEINAPYVIEGKWELARGLARSLFRKTLCVRAVCASAVFFIQATAEKDPSVGGPAQIAVISPSRGYMAVDKNQKKLIAPYTRKLLRQYQQSAMSG